MEPAWNVEDYRTIFAKDEPSAAVFYLHIISFIYGIISLISGFWIQLIICITVFLFSLTLKFSHP